MSQEEGARPANGGGAAVAGVAVLPCLSSNYSNLEQPDDPTGMMAWAAMVRSYGDSALRAEQRRAETLNTLSPQQKKSAVALAWNVEWLCDRNGIERIGFFTLTFAEHITDPKEAQRRYNSLLTGVLRGRYPAIIRVLERQKSGRIHYHLLVVLPVDIRTGFDFDAAKRRDYSSACSQLRQEWAFWRETAANYGFGRVELLPIRSSEAAIARYVGKYISKHIENRLPEDRGLRLVEYSGRARVANTRFSWVTKMGKEWRRKMALFAAIVGEIHGHCEPVQYSQMKTLLGATWAHRHREFILGLP